jgi:hypothetical protein
MLDLTLEKAIPLQDVAKEIPGRGGRPLNFSTVWRWVLKGCRGPDGAMVRLRAARIGGRWLTSQQALQEFLEALTPQLDAEPAPKPRNPTKRARASERARKQLTKIGI